jgi:mevalonate kinase
MVGSSGVLVAAIYDKYAQDKSRFSRTHCEKLLQLKNIFSQMESFFHGKFWPWPFKQLFEHSILINSKDNIEATGIPSQIWRQRSLLLDSGIVGETAPMVTIFMENLKDKGRTMLKTSL